MEWGPRALGNRSILGDPRHPRMQERINRKIKSRESFRPFAPSVLLDACDRLFQLDVPSPYMLLVAPVREAIRRELPRDVCRLDWPERLEVARSELPAVTHVDYSARIHTVDPAINPRFWRLIDAFKRLTGYGCVVNTSFNVRGEPIVCTPEDAYRCFMNTDMDYLVIGNLLFDKHRQPAWEQD
jgi:carbamoyltransferase